VATYDETVANYRSTVLARLQDVEDNLTALTLLAQEVSVQDVCGKGRARIGGDRQLNQYKAGTANYLAVVVLRRTRSANAPH
jgi:outer membrane protein TolC